MSLLSLVVMGVSFMLGNGVEIPHELTFYSQLHLGFCLFTLSY